MIFKARLLSFTSSFLLLGLLTGCSADTKHGAVTGTVSLDGQPIKSGNIRFDPADGRTATADATITDGKFSATVPPGEKRVSITAPRVVGKKKVYETPNSPTVDLTEEMLPKRYNAQSELKATVKLGNQELPAFDLKSK
ncbi:MAG TPA: hypothetical protein VH107_08805 [Lacipirellulaceae bacterium]|jgi:hypothetical protein|nr:hypothetical protein [Lacipirellulaceae bacterium]